MQARTHIIEGALSAEQAASLRAGDQVRFTGTMYTARDAAHARLAELLEHGEAAPFDLGGAIIYYTGPAPAKPGQVIGPSGPTSSYRMDPYTPALLDAGVRAIIGKGARGPQVVEALERNGAVYLAAIGGAAALISQCIKSAELVAYEDLGTEAIRKLEVVDMPLTVAIDCQGTSVYEEGPAAYLAGGAKNDA